MENWRSFWNSQRSRRRGIIYGRPIVGRSRRVWGHSWHSFNGSIKSNIATRYRSQNVFNWNINFIPMTSHYTTTVKTASPQSLEKSGKRVSCVVWNLCKFAFKVIKLIQVFSFLFCAMFALAYTQFCFHKRNSFYDISFLSRAEPFFTRKSFSMQSESSTSATCLGQSARN